jgi:hypothetical protein
MTHVYSPQNPRNPSKDIWFDRLVHSIGDLGGTFQIVSAARRCERRCHKIESMKPSSKPGLGLAPDRLTAAADQRRQAMDSQPAIRPIPAAAFGARALCAFLDLIDPRWSPAGETN